MNGEHPELDELQAAYKNSVQAWIAGLARRKHSLPSTTMWPMSITGSKRTSKRMGYATR